MKPISQRVSGVVGAGDCLMACAASILELSLDELPTLPDENDRDAPHWFTIFAQAMQDRGFRVVEAANEPALAPHGYAIAIGPAPRYNSAENHAVVALDGHVVHDPHPTREGVEAIVYWFLLVPLARTPSRLSPTSDGIEAVL